MGLLAQHPLWRRRQQTPERDHREQQGDEQADHGAQHKGLPGGRRHLRRQQTPQQLQESQVQQVTEQPAQYESDTGQQPQQTDHPDPQLSPTGAERLQQRQVIGLTPGEVIHGDLHRQGSQQQPHQGGQTEEALAALQGPTAELGVLARLQQPLFDTQSRLQLSLSGSHRLPVTAKQVTVLHPAARQENLGARHIIQVHQGSGRQEEGGKALIGFLQQLTRHPEADFAQFQLIADTGLQQRQQTGRKPDLPRLDRASRA